MRRRTLPGLVIPLEGNPSSVQVIETRQSLVLPRAFGL